ncbi:MAG: hypothetical protein RJQ00_13175 [Vicingaceae bacterium]|jgi:hypothetical protein
MIPACSDAPTKIERDNPGDPEVFGFVLNPVQDISTSILEDKMIEVVWTDSSLVPTNYILRKKLRASDSYTPIDTLDAETRKFIDESGEIFEDTKYEIISLRKQQSGEEVFSEGINSGIDFGRLVSPTYTYNFDTTAIVFNWEFNTDWPFTAVVTTYDNDLERDVVLDTLSNTNTYTTPTFEKDFQEKFFELKFFLSNGNFDLENPYTRYGGEYFTMEFIPEITGIEIINESKVIINWEDNSGFEDGFQILRSQGSNRNDAGEPEVLATVPPNTTSFTDTLNPFIGYTRGPFGGESLKKSYYGILAYKNDTQTGSFGAELVIDIARPELSIQNSTTSSVTLTWDTDSRDLVKNYILERKINEGSFLTYKTVDPNVNQFTDTQIDTSNTYTYRIKSLTSRYSESVRIGFVGSPVQVDFYDLNGANHIKFSKSENLITASLENDTRIAIVDISAGNVIYSKSVSQSYLSGPSIYEPENFIGYYSTEDGLFTVKDFETDTTVFNLKNPLGRFPGFVTSIFSEQDNSLYMMAGRSELKKFDLTTKQVVFSKPAFGPTYTIREFDLSPNQDSVVFNYRGSFQLIDSEGNSLNFSPSIPSNSDARKVRFSPSGKYISLISGFNEGYIYNAKTKDQIRSLSTEAISFSHNEKYLATIKHKLLKILDFDSMNLKITKAFNSAVLDVKFSSKENILFVSTKYNGIFKFKITDNKTWSQIN